MKANQKFKTFAQQLIALFEAESIGAAFGIPGGSLTPIYQALVDSKKIRTILAQHETAAVYMAMGYCLESFPMRVPLCFGTSGAGITNLVTGALSANEESFPMLILTGNVSSHLFGKGAVQDSSEHGSQVESHFKKITAQQLILRSTEKSDVDNIKELLSGLWIHRRPVHLSIPVDFGVRPAIEPNLKQNRVATRERELEL